MSLYPGDTLSNDRYRIICLLGRGGFGFVYLAQDTLLGEQVAIKELIPTLLGEPAVVQRFLQEARATQRLTHPNIVRTHNVFQDRGNYYLVMEYLPGGSLADRLEYGPLPAEESVSLVRDLCEALAYAHQQGVVHCDLKPANVLFDAQGVAHVADFGIAHVSDQLMTRLALTGTGVSMGTVRYMAPEQLDGVRDDPRIDVYAIGALMYEMLSGGPYLDFETGTTPAAHVRNVQRIQGERPRPLRAVNRQVPEWLGQAVDRALRKAPQDRYPDASALAAALVQQAARKPRRRGALPGRIWPVGLGTAMLSLVLLAGLALSLFSDTAQTPTTLPPATHAPRASSTGEPTQPAPAPTSTAAAATPPEPAPTQVPPTPLPTSSPIPHTATPEPSPTPVQIVGPYIGQEVAVRVPVADLWPEPRAGGGQKRETQVLMGEYVQIVSIRDGWYQVAVVAQPSSKDPRGYPGWIQATDVTLRPYELDRFVVIMASSAYLRSSPEASGRLVAAVSLDTRLKIVEELAAWLHVELPDGGGAWIERSQVRVEESGGKSYRPTPDDLVRTAKSLLDIPYLWGGSSWQALDCSGVVYRSFHAHGITLARDSRDQAVGGMAVTREELEPGDLVFYAAGGPSGTVSHVGLYVGDGMAIATYDAQRVMLRPYDDPTYLKEYWGARRYW